MTSSTCRNKSVCVFPSYRINLTWTPAFSSTFAKFSLHAKNELNWRPHWNSVNGESKFEYRVILISMFTLVKWEISHMPLKTWQISFSIFLVYYEKKLKLCMLSYSSLVMVPMRNNGNLNFFWSKWGRHIAKIFCRSTHNEDFRLESSTQLQKLYSIKQKLGLSNH